MKRTTAPGSVAGEFVDRVEGVNSGTIIEADDLNNFQEEICNAIEDAGITLDSGSQVQLWHAMIAMRKEIGELFFLPDEKAPAQFTFPAVRLDDSTKTLAAANYPLLVPFLRGLKAKAGGVTDFSVTVSGSEVTFPNDVPGLAMIAALVEDEAFHGSFTDYRSININGTDYPIAGYTPATRIVTVTGTPTTGAQTGIIYPYRISGSTTTARLCKADGLVLASDNTTERVSGLRTRDRMQQITGSINKGYGSGGNSGTPIREGNELTGAFAIGGTLNYSTAYNSTTSYEIDFDSAGSPGARAGSTTRDRSLGGYLYMWARSYVP